MAYRITTGATSAVKRFKGQQSFAERVAATRSMDSLFEQARALLKLAQEANTWQDWCQLSQASAHLPPSLQACVDEELVTALAGALRGQIPVDFSDQDLSTLEAMRQRMPLGDSKDALNALTQPIKNVPGDERHTIELHGDFIALLALRLLRRVQSAGTRADFTAAIDELLNFRLVCRPFNTSARTCALQALALRLPFAGLPDWVQALSSSLGQQRPDAAGQALLSQAQRSVLTAYLQFGADKHHQQLGRLREDAYGAIQHGRKLPANLGLAHPQGAAWLAYAYRLRHFPLPLSHATDELANNIFLVHFKLYCAVQDHSMPSSLPLLFELAMATRAYEQFHRTSTWRMASTIVDMRLELHADFMVQRMHHIAPGLGDMPDITQGLTALSAILLLRGEPERIASAHIDDALRFLCAYTKAGGQGLPPSAQEALALVIGQVGLTDAQAQLLHECLENAHRAQQAIAH